MPALWMVVASILFACMNVCVKLAGADHPAGELVFFRGFISLIFITIVALLTGVSLRTKVWKQHLLRGVSGALGLQLIFYAITVLPLATATMLNYTSPIFVTLILMFWYRERVSWPSIVTIITGLFGVALLLRPTLTPDQWLGALLGLASGLLAGIAYVALRGLGRAGEPDVRTVFWFSLTTTLVGLPWMLTEDLHGLRMRDAPLLCGIGIFAVLAQLALTRAYRLGKTVVVANLIYLGVVFAAILGALIWQEQISLLGWLGIIIIICSGIMMSYFNRQRATHPDEHLSAAIVKN